jgi:lysyl-tRNA synthetase class 2
MSEDLNEQQLLRIEKLNNIRVKRNAYPNNFRPRDLAAALATEFSHKEKAELATLDIKASVAGRIMFRRNMGKASFLSLQDRSARIQIYVKKDAIEDEQYVEFENFDIGDLVYVEGALFKTNTNELSIAASQIKLVSKCLRPLPDKWHGLAEKELCYRQRYVDLIVNEESRKIFKQRSQIIQLVRNFFVNKDFMEVETPMMHVIPGGAAAKPFVTHHNALDMELYLRIAPELYLKRLVVGGFERVFEINRNFRNEGLSTRHNPEFTMIEFYQAYSDYHELMDLTEELFKFIAHSLFDSKIVNYQGHEYDLSKPFDRLTIEQSILKYNKDLELSVAQDRDKLFAYVQTKGVKAQDFWDLGKLQFELFEHVVEDQLIEPTFIIAHPTAISPLARKNDLNPEVTDRFELFISGREIANGFSELNDPFDQADRFLEQVKNKDAGDEEAMHYDADYIRALEYGMPPTAGEGIGIDRLVMFFTNAMSIKDVLLFPHMRMEQD